MVYKLILLSALILTQTPTPDKVKDMTLYESISDAKELAVNQAIQLAVEQAKEAERLQAIEQEKEAERLARVIPAKPQSQDILITNYYTGDGSSLDITASGLSSKDFAINDKGYYTYDNKVVIATANTSRLARPLKEGYNTYELYTTLTIEINGVTYDAIILDVCGACYGVAGEQLQRYDVYTTHDVLGKSKGKIYN